MTARFRDGPIPWNPTRPEQVEVIVALAKARRPRRILDAGCGPGYLASALLVALGDVELTAFDVSEQMADEAGRRLGRDVFVCDLAGDWSALGGPFDMVLAVQAVHHLDDDGKRAAMANAFAALEPGGLYLQSDPVDFALYDLQKTLLNRARGSAGFPLLTPGFSRARFDEQLEENGDRLSTLDDQLRWLRETGFDPVECFWQYANRAIFGGVKP